MPDRSERSAAAPGTLLVISILAAAIAGTAMIRAARVPVGSRPMTAAPDMRIDVNIATEVQLNALPGIGPALAARIATDRETRGPFESIDDLARVHGIGPRLIERIGPHVVCD
ncbi:MAG: helix-hairpin-helix domain-containing protein [Phycisphaerales bacterium]